MKIVVLEDGVFTNMNPGRQDGGVAERSQSLPLTLAVPRSPS